MSERPRVPLGDRFAAITTLRILLAVTTIAVAELAPGPLGGPEPVLVWGCVAFAGIAFAGEALRRATDRRGVRLMSGLLLVDGVFLAFVTALTDGARSPLSFLVYIHVVAATLLLSHRSGLKVAVWHALLSFVVASEAVAHLLDISPPRGGLVALRATSYLLVAVAVAACSTINERALERSRRDARSLVSLSLRLEAAYRPHDICVALAEHVVSSLGFRRAAVTGPDGTGAVVVRGGVAALFRHDGEVDLGEAGVAGRAWRSRSAQLAARLEADEILDGALPTASNLVVVPLLADGRPMGVVAAEWEAGDRAHIDEDTVTAVVQAAGHAGMSLRASELLAQMEQLAMRDRLTGLPNRARFDDVLARERERAFRSGQVLSLVLLDLDNFKAINDTHGHQTGDAVLRSVGAVLAGETRRYDLVARYGGEEFVMILPDARADEAAHVADRVRDRIRENVTPVSVTASAGVAAFPAHATAEDTLVSAADAALYQAKRAGRDCTVCAAAPEVGDDEEAVQAPSVAATAHATS